MTEAVGLDLADIAYIQGRLTALAGTVRHKMSDELRKELEDIVALLSEYTGIRVEGTK